MDPFTLMALMKGGEALGQGVSGYMAADATFGESEADRLKELKRREELGTLGFSGEEQNRIMRDLLNPIQAREAQRSLETRQILGAGDLGASQSAIANMIQADKGEAARAGASEEFLQQQMSEKRLQEKELRDLAKAQDAEKAAKQQAIVSALTLGIAGQAETAQRRMLYDEMLSGQAAADAKTAGAGTSRALSEEDLAMAYELMGYVPGSK
jgi:hypothetical protein